MHGAMNNTKSVSRKHASNSMDQRQFAEQSMQHKSFNNPCNEPSRDFLSKRGCWFRRQEFVEYGDENMINTSKPKPGFARHRFTRLAETNRQRVLGTVSSSGRAWVT
jgi:hypothetical protein